MQVKRLRKLKSIFLKTLPLVMLVSLFILSSCIQAPSSTRKSLLSSNTTASPSGPNAKLPTFTEGNNFIQNGGTVYTNVVNFDLSFSDSLQLRGKDVDSYIRNSGTGTITCLTGRFSASTVNQILIFAAIPRSFYNFTTNTLEYYYNLSPADETSNKNFCQKTGLINKLYSLYPTLTPVYKTGSLCPGGTCLSTNYTSQSLELYSQSGVALPNVATAQLIYSLSNNPNINTPTGNVCVTNTDCKSQGYDCCSLGICVKDLALKPGVNKTSTDYVQALADILNNPNHIYNYPNYYYLCSSSVVTPTNPETPTNPVNDADTRIKNLTDLYNCTTKLEGEMGICTKTYTNVSVGNVYSSGKDDRSFSSTYTNDSLTATVKEDLISIQEIVLGEVTLFHYDQIPSDSTMHGEPYAPTPNYFSMIGHHNDDHTTGAAITLTAIPSNSVSKTLTIRYKNDASCTQLNTTLGKCEKYYIQGQQASGDTLASVRRGRVSDHYPASNFFKLPYYADTSKTITVTVDGITQKQDVDWKINSTMPANIEFLPSQSGGLRVNDSQKVRISFFVNLSVYKVMDSKLEALSQIQTLCHCADLNCGLAPIKNTAGNLVDYSCVYPDPAPVIPPVSQIIYLSSKTVPVRFFDSAGISKASITGSTSSQEGLPFSYRKDNLLNPTNVPDITNPVAGDTYVGINEIYGSLSYNANSAKPAKEVAVTKGKIYDIYVDGGTYSNCVQCGNDYYSTLNRLFPLTQFASGLLPLQTRTDRTQANGVRADDMAFGRACFVPATMIPWSHSIATDTQTQRLNRLRAQHFYYANGYQHDWYGFDYGSVIGSFDGVKWFAIGTNRRIKADTNKLFIAVNGPFGDLALENTFTVSINDGALNPVGTNMVTSDLESDGAQCQKFHQCSTDNDCATTLGWDYICSSVNDVTTSWPAFDENAKEIPDTAREDRRLVNILGISSSGKRCVYRGRGSACTQNYLEGAININSTWNQAQVQSLHTCSANNYCQALTTNNVLADKFNNRIARFGKVRADVFSDSFGLGAKIAGRPMEFNASEQIRTETAKSFNSNKVASVCIPGRSPEVDSFVAQNSTVPTSEYMGDKILGIGMSYRKNATPVTGVKNYLIGCSVMDNSKNYYYAKGTPNASLSEANSTNDEIVWNSATQSISTNALGAFTALFNSKGISFPLYTNNSAIINSLTFTENRCLRAPGASCFTDLDCAPSKEIANKIKMLSAEDTSVTAILNKYEIKFWQEELVCSQATAKSDASYSAFNNRCCREVGKTISIPSTDYAMSLDMKKAPGVDLPISAQKRYSRVSTVYKDMKGDSVNYPALEVAALDQCGAIPGCQSTVALSNQFKTFAAFAERTSCSGDWIRNFADGKHKWEKTKLQSFTPSTFRCFNWIPSSTNPYTCKDLEKDDPACALVQTSAYSGKAKGIMNFLGKLELLGIPQIAIESAEFYSTTTEGDMSCRSNPGNQNDLTYPGGTSAGAGATYMAPLNLYNAGAVAEYISGGKRLYSAADMNNFMGMKQVFKADEVVGCLPAGTTMTAGADPNLCCTGFINGKNNKCQLPDFVDVSVYTNRYVSSEAKKLSPTLFDQNGYIKDPSYVAQLACEKNICASGTLAYGLLVSRLKTPGQENLEDKKFRFLEGNAQADDANGLLSLYTLGLKLNTHAYCYPAGSSSNQDLTIISCGQ